MFIFYNKQAEKLRSCKMKEGWMKNAAGWWRRKDDDSKLFRGFAEWQTDQQTFVNVELLLRLKIIAISAVLDIRKIIFGKV